MSDSVRAARLERLLPGGRGVWVPVDHAVSDGPLRGLDDLAERLPQLARAGVDVIVSHKGAMRDPVAFAAAGGRWVMHLSGGTVHGGGRGKRLIASVEEALRRGADGVSLQIDLGHTDESDMLADLGAVSAACHEWQLPLLVMAYPRGPNLRIADGDTTGGVAHAVRLAWEFGADVVKAPWTGDAQSFATAVAAAPIPVLVAGGPMGGHGVNLLEWVEASLEAGGVGVCIGRQVFAAADPSGVAAALAALVHGPLPVARRHSLA